MQNYFNSKKINNSLALFLSATVFLLLAGCGDGGTAPITATTTTGGSTTVTSIQLALSPTSVKSDNSTTTTITVTALDAGNAVVPNTPITMSTDTGNLSLGSVTTSSTGTATLTLLSGTASKTNRTATITATSGAVSAQIPVQIVGSTVTVNPSTATLSDDGLNPVTLIITAKDASGNIVPNAAVTLTKTGVGNVTLTPMVGTTDVNGQLSVIASGAAGGVGSVTVRVAAVGATATSTLTVSTAGATFAIDQQTLGATVIANNSVTAMNLSETLTIQVNAPLPIANVVFATTIGLWNGASSVLTVPVAAGKASAALTSTGAGVANILVYDLSTPATSDSLTVAMTAPASTASKITINAAPSLVTKSTGTTIGYSTLTASVKDATGNPVGGAPVAFQILNPAGGGETVSPVVVLSATTTSGGLTLGDAPTTFTSGSIASGAAGIQVRASVVGTAIATEANIPFPLDVTPSGNDASVVIGGTAGSVVFGMATVLGVNSNATQYIQAMSVLVADSNGNPAPQGTAVNLSVWPIEWSTGSGCVQDADSATAGTFLNEDGNENVFMDAGEDGKRINSLGTQVGGRKDSILTPPNSAAGSLPGTVYTDVNGVANFDLIYPKTSGIWIVDRIRARTTVLGSEALGEMIFRLPILKSDGTPCLLPPSPYYF